MHSTLASKGWVFMLEFNTSFLLFYCSLISRAWEAAGTRYDDAKLAKRSSSNLLSDGDSACSLELWKFHSSGGEFPETYVY